MAAGLPNVFEVTDPLGNRIVCERKQWDSHVVAGHIVAGHTRMFGPDMEQEAGRAIEKPNAICRDADFPNRMVYYALRHSKQNYLKVVTEKVKTKNFKLITAFVSDGPKEDEELLWMGN